MVSDPTSGDKPTERRLAAILAADVVGYSRLMGEDELGTLRALKALRGDLLDPTIAGYRGRIVKTTGDGLLVEFASAVDAVACAVAIQRDMRQRPPARPREPRLELRIGVNVGDIIIDGQDIFGDGVNVAARLESICEPGGVTLSRAARDQVRDKLAIRFADLGEQSVKNIARPLRVFSIGAEAVGAIPATLLPERSQPVVSAVAATSPVEAPRRPPRTWRRRLILIAVALLVLSQQGGVRHAINQIIAWATAAPDTASPAKQLSTTAPPAEQQLAPLPPPIVVPSAPAPAVEPGGDSGSGGRPIELHRPTSAFSSEVDSGSREENALYQHIRANSAAKPAPLC